MSSTYLNLVGPPPVITSLAWRAWKVRLVAGRLAECPLARPTTYYFSQAGSDTTPGDGSQGNPWKTIAKLNSTLTANPAGNIALLLRRGDVWREVSSGTTPLGITITQLGITIGSWGLLALRKPVITAFATAYAGPYGTSATRVDSYARTYSKADTNTVAWFRESLESTQVYRKMASVSDVDAVAGSWYQTGGVVYWHPIDDQDATANGRVYEVVYANSVIGIAVGDGVANPDGTRIDNIRVDGFGANTGGSVSPYCIKGQLWGTSAFVASNVEAYFSGNHTIGNAAPTATSGGIFTAIRCRAGWNTFNDTTYDSYAPNGGQECILDECEALGAGLPSGIQPGAASGPPFIMHSSNNTTYPAALCINFGCSNRPGPYQTNQPFSGGSNAPAWTDLADCRSWVVDDRYYARNQSPSDLNPQSEPLTTASQGTTTVTLATIRTGARAPQNSQMVTLVGGTSGPELIKVSSYNSTTGVITFTTNIVGSGRTTAIYNVCPDSVSSGQVARLPIQWLAANTVGMNCRWDHVLLFAGTNNADVMLLQNSVAGNLLINAILILDASYPLTTSLTAQRYRYINSGSTYELYNCRVHFRLGSRTVGALDLNAGKGTTASGIVAKNCLFSAEYGGGGAFNVGIGNVGANQINNAYVGASVRSGIAGYDQDPFFVELPGGMVPFGHPEPGSPLISAHDQLIRGYRLEYDADWRPRPTSTPAIGPYEPLAAVSSGSGRVGILNGGAL